MNKKALIFGITGMDGSYLTEFLLEKGYEVHGIIRRSSSFNTGRIDHIFNKIKLHYGDVTDALSVDNVISKIKPDEIYNLSAMSHVQISFEIPNYTGQVDAIGTLNVIESARIHVPNSKIYQACHDIETQIITEDGIKNYTDLKIGDLVYTINEQTKKIEKNPIKNILSYHYEGDMVKIKNKRIDKLVTPNHNMLLQYDGIENLVYEDALSFQKNIKIGRVSKVSLPILNKINDNKSVIVKLSDIVNLDDRPQNIHKNIIEEMDSDELLYLIGIFIGDGIIKKRINYKKGINGGSIRDEKGQFKKIEDKKYETVTENSSFIEFYIPKEDVERSKILNIFHKNGIDYKLNKDNVTITFSSYILSKIFNSCKEYAHNKSIPKWVYNMPYSSLLELKNGLIGSDGHRRKCGRESYTTVSKKLASDIIILCQYLGESCSLNTKKATTSFFNDKKKGTLRPINCKESYRINFSKIRTNKIYNYNTDIVKYNNIVWCLEIENTHNFLVIRNGKICFSGNCTSELFGGMDYNRPETGYTEESPFHPRSPYGVAKLYGFWICKNYREAYNQFICNGILFNHSSFRRGGNFVEKKIVDALVKIKQNINNEIEVLKLGNLYSKRDIGYAKEYVEGMWLMLQQDKPDDFVLSTNETFTIKEMVNYCLDYLDIKYYWSGVGLNEKCYQTESNKLLVEIDERYFRPSEVDLLLGDATKAKNILGWEAKTKLPELLKIMIDKTLNEDKY